MDGIVRKNAVVSRWRSRYKRVFLSFLPLHFLLAGVGGRGQNDNEEGWVC